MKTSAIHDRLVAAGAYFRDVSGWEGADWYAPPGFEPKVEKLSWGRENWFPWWEAEHRAAREDVILMDMSFMSKFLGAGPRRRARAQPHLRQQCRRSVGSHHLHPMAQRDGARWKPT